MIENKESEEEIYRWREACEMEVETGKKAVNEHKELVSMRGQSSYLYIVTTHKGKKEEKTTTPPNCCYM